MKYLFLLPALTALFLVHLPRNAAAQEKQQTRLHLIIEENGKVTKDTSVTVDRSLCEKEIQAVVSGITGGDVHPPCMARQHQCMHGGTMTDTCRHMKKEMHQKGYQEGQGQPAHCMKETGKMETDSLPCRRTREVKIIEIRDENADVQEGKEMKVIEKKVIITGEGERAEKTIILESPGQPDKSKKKPK